MKKLKKLINNIILCIRFPFLYPRNRWTGKHRVNALGSILYRLYEKSFDKIIVTAKLEPSNYDDINGFIYRDKVIEVRLNKCAKMLTLNNGIDEKCMSLNSFCGDKFYIVGAYVETTLLGHPMIIIRLKNKNEEDTTNYGFSYSEILLISNKTKHSLYKIISWIDKNILDRILFLPSYTELDALEPGWRKAFGIQICKEIKCALKKHKFLRKYRIIQIKEKFGSLHWYDNGAPEEVWHIINKYENISYNTCICCGKPAKYRTTDWISPYCEDCVPKNSTFKEIKEND